jgi:MFS family permease
VNADRPEGAETWTAQRRALTLGLVLTITLVAFESLAVATVMPDVKDDLGGLHLYGWVFSGFFLGQLVGIVLAGQSADRHGPARPFALALALFAGALVVAGLAPTMAVLVGARIVQGIGGGAIPALAYVAVGRGYPPALRPRLFALFSSAWIIPGLVSPSIAAFVSEHVGWRVVFLGLVPLVVLAAALAIPALAHLHPEPDAGPPDRDRGRDAVLVTAGAALVLAGLSTGSPLIGALLFAPGALVGVRAFMRLVPPGTLTLQPGLPAAIATRGLLTFAFFGTDAYVTLAFTSVRGTSTAAGGLALTLTALSWATAAWIQEQRVHVTGPRRLVTIGMLVLALGIAGMTVALWDAVPLAVAIATWAVAGFGIGLAYAPLSLTVLDRASPGREGDATASLQLCDVLGVALGTGVTGALIAAGDALGWTRRAPLLVAFIVMGCVALAGAVAAQRLPRALAGASDASVPVD